MATCARRAHERTVLYLPSSGRALLTRIADVKIGRTATHLVVAIGPWSVWLPTDTTAKYPDVVGVAPRYAPTTVRIDPSDAAALLPVLPGLPGGEHELRPVTLDTDRGVRIRGRCESGEKLGETREVALDRSMASGPATRVVFDRRVLARAFVLGCHTARLTSDKPAVLEGNDCTLVAAPLDPALIALPATNHPENTVPHTDSERRTVVKPETNGHVSPRGDPADPLELAEELRAALSEAAGIAARLVAALRQGSKQKKVLSALMTNLKQLNLGGTS
jgi:hypothetical protein